MAPRVWEGDGVIEYDVDGDTRRHDFRQHVSFSHDGLGYLNYSARLELVEGTGDEPDTVPLTAESGFWRLARPRDEGDVGPGYLPPSAPPSFPDADAVETLRNAEGGFDVEAAIVHPTGLSELYLGTVRGPRIDLATDAVVTSPARSPSRRRRACTVSSAASCCGRGTSRHWGRARDARLGEVAKRD